MIAGGGNIGRHLSENISEDYQVKVIESNEERAEFLSEIIDVSKEKHELRKILGYLPQEFGLYPKVNALELFDHLAIMKGISNKSDREKLTKSLLSQTNLWKYRNRKLGTFSGGMKQRFEIGRAHV